MWVLNFFVFPKQASWELIQFPFPSMLRLKALESFPCIIGHLQTFAVCFGKHEPCHFWNSNCILTGFIGVKADVEENNFPTGWFSIKMNLKDQTECGIAFVFFYPWHMFL